MIVSARLLLGGWKTAYVADATVRHSHHHSYRQAFRHYFDIGVLHARESWLLEEFGNVGGEGKRFAWSELRTLWPEYTYLIPDSLIRLLVKYAGYRIGRMESKFAPALAKRLSQQEQFWR